MILQNNESLVQNSGSFDSIKMILENLLSINDDVWVKRKNITKKNIENCNGIAQSDQTTNTCVLCVALNGTVFKNNNKPEYYHMNCKCNNEKYDLKEVTLDFLMSKITDYLFKNVSKIG